MIGTLVDVIEIADVGCVVFVETINDATCNVGDQFTVDSQVYEITGIDVPRYADGRLDVFALRLQRASKSELLKFVGQKVSVLGIREV